MKMLLQPVLGLACVALCLTACSKSSNSDSSTPAPAAATTASVPQTAQDYVNSNFTLVPDADKYMHNPGYKDAGGLVWGLALVQNISPDSMQAVCEHLHAVAPTVSQLAQLAKYLGAGTQFGFHPELLSYSSGQSKDGSTKVNVSWGSLDKAFLLGADSLNENGTVWGIKGTNGALWTLSGGDMSSGGTLAKYRGYPDADPSEAEESPDEMAFSTICLYR